MLYKKKSGVEVHVVGKRLVVYDNKANVIGQLVLNNYAWPIRKGNYSTFGYIG